MSDVKKTKKQLIEELLEARARIAELEALEAERKQAAEELTVLNELGQALTAHLSVEEVVDEAYRQVSRLLDTTNFYIALYNPDKDEITFAIDAIKGEFRKDRVTRQAGQGLTEYIIRNQTPLLIREDLPRWFEEEMGVEQIGRLALSWLGVPLMIGDQVLGVMAVQSYTTPRLYDEHARDLLSAIANQTAIALQNAYLFEETRRQAQQMGVINEVGQAITSVLELDTVLQQIVDITKIRFGHYYVCIVLVEGDQLIPKSGSTIGDSDVRLRFDLMHIDLMHGPSLVAEAMRTGQPVLADDTLNDPRYLPLEELSDTRSELSLPIKAQDRVIGVLDVQSDRPFAYDQADVDLLRSLANQAGVAIENARLFEEARIRAEELAVLNELGQALTARLSVEEVLEEAYRQASRLVDTTNFYIGLYDPRKDEIAFVLDVSESEIDKQITVMPASQGLTGYIVRNRTSVLLGEDASEWEAEIGIDTVGQQAPSWLGVPLMVGDQVLGVMAVQSFTTPNLYNEHDQELLTAIASQTAIAIQNARLFEDTKSQVAQLTALQETTKAVVSTLEINKLLNLITQQATTLLQGDGGILNLVDWEKKEDEVVAASGSCAHALGFRGPLEGSLSGWVTLRNQPVISNQLQSDDRVDRYVRSGELQNQSAAIAPLTIRDKVMGTLVVMDKQGGKRAFNQADLDLLMVFAGQAAIALQNAQMVENLEQIVEERTTELRKSLEERERLQQEVIEAQKRALQELSTPIIPIMERIIVMPLIGSIDTLRAKDIMRALLAGIRNHRAKVVILDITGVPIVDSGVANNLNKTIQAARLKGAQTIVTGISDAVAEAVVDLGIDWSGIETLADLQTGLVVALSSLGIKLTR